MKKVALSLMALALVGVSAFADAPKWDPKVSTEIKGEATVTLGYDLDTGVAALANSTSAELVIDLVSGGDRATASDKEIWGEIKVVSDGDPTRIKGDGTDTHFANGFKVKVDYAKIHFGKDAYLSITSRGTQIEYAAAPDAAFYAGARSGLYGATFTQKALAKQPGKGPATAGGAEFGLAIPSFANVTIDFGTTEAWVSAGANRNKTNYAVKGEVSLTAVPNLDLVVGADYTSKEGVDQALGGKVGYKLMMGEKAYLKPAAGVTMYKLGGVGDYKTLAHAGVLYALDGKADTFDNYGMKASGDYAAYPGVSVGISYTDKNINAVAKDEIGLGMPPTRAPWLPTPPCWLPTLLTTSAPTRCTPTSPWVPAARLSRAT